MVLGPFGPPQSKSACGFRVVRCGFYAATCIAGVQNLLPNRRFLGERVQPAPGQSAGWPEWIGTSISWGRSLENDKATRSASSSGSQTRQAVTPNDWAKAT